MRGICSCENRGIPADAPVFPCVWIQFSQRICCVSTSGYAVSRALEVGCVELHAGDLAVIIGRVVINAPVRVAAAGIERDLKLTVVQLAAAALLLHAREDVEKLADVGVLGPLRTGVGAHERRAHKARGR